MPALIPVVAAYAASTAVTTIIGTSLLAGVLAAVAGAAAAAFVSKMMADGRSPQGSNVARGVLIDATQSYGPIPVLYGSRRVGGLRTVTEVSNSTDRQPTATQLTINAAALTYTVPGIGGGFVADIGVTPFATNDIGNPTYGVAFTKVGSSPGPKQYAVDGNGTYTFNAADAGTGVNIAYSYRPQSAINSLLNLVIVWCEGQIAGIDQIYLDDVPISDGRFNGLIYYENYLGTDTQTASPTLIAMLGGKWTAKDTNSGFAYTYLQLAWNPDVFPRGMPVVTADLRGKLVYDPRDGTTKYSDNPALCIRDYLTNARYGWAADSSMIDDASFKDAAYFCDQQVSIPTATGTTTQARYLCRGLVDVDQKIIDNLNQLLSSCRGFLVFSGGQYKLRLDRDATVPGATLAFDFTTGSAAALDGAATAFACTRAGATATRVNASGLIETVAAHTPRFNFDPVTLICRGLLVEESRVNYCQHSAAIGGTAGAGGFGWVTPSASGVSITLNTDVAPDGTTTADTVTDGDITQNGCVQYNLSTASSTTTRCGSWYIKKTSGDPNYSCVISQYTSGGTPVTATRVIDTNNGVITASTGVGTADIEDCGQYWRVWVSATDNASGNTVLATQFYPAWNTTGAIGGVITTTGSKIAWGHQVEVGTFPTSIIPTAGATVTRNADQPTCSSISGFFNGNEGAICIEAEQPILSGSFGAAAFFSDGTANNRIDVALAGSTGNQAGRLTIVSASVIQADLLNGNNTLQAGVIARIAAAYNSNDFALYVNGASVGSDASGSVPSGINRLDLGWRLIGNNQMNGHLRKFGYIPRRISDTELQTLSSQSPFTLNEDNIIGGWKIALPQKRTRFNRVKAQFIDAANLWQPNVALESSATYLADDGNEILEAQIDLPFTPDVYRAHQIAMQVLKQSRSGIGVTLTATIAATQLEVGDVVPLTHASPGWVSKYFRVENVKLLSSDEVQLALSEYDANVYSLNPLSYVEPAPSTNLPDPSAVGAPGTPSVTEVLYQTSGSAGVKSKATVAWAASADLLVQNGGRYEVQYQLVGAMTWTVAANVTSSVLSQDIFDLAAASYNFRVVAFNTAGRSAPSPIVTKQLIGLSAPPSDLTNFTVQSYSGQAKFTWDKLTAASDLDVLIGGRIFVRWTPKSAGAGWEDGSLVNPDGYPGDTSIGFGPLMTGTYLAKACDSSGNFSVNAVSFVVTEAILSGFTTLATVTESPSFAGAKTNLAAVDGVLKLAGSTFWDSIPGNIDTWTENVDYQGGVQLSGSYSFASKLDLGSAQAVRLFSTIDSTAFDALDLWDSRVGNIDTWSYVDGAVIEDCDVQLFVRSTNDDPNGGAPNWGPWHPLGLVGDYSARGFDFRLDFTNGDTSHDRQVATLSVAAKH